MDTDFILVKSSNLNLYRKVPFYFENRHGHYALYKPIGVTLGEMRIRERMHPKKLYIKRKNKIEAIQEVQSEYNREIKKCLRENDFTKVRDIVQNDLGGGPHCLDSLMGGISSDSIVYFFMKHQAASANG
jgi:hypothetical protein